MKLKWSRAIAYLTRGLVSVLALVVGVSVFNLLVRTRPPVTRDEEGATDRVVEVVIAQRVSTARRWEGFGVAEARHLAEVAAEVSAVVRRRPAEIEPGRAVTRGQVLVELDDHDFVQEHLIAQQNMARFEAQLKVLDAEERNWTDQLTLAREESDVARLELEKAIEALDRGAGSPIEVDRRRREYSAALRTLRTIEEAVEKVPARRADLEASRRLEQGRAAIAERNVQRCVVTSPLDGVLQDVRLQEGERVAPGAVVARIVNLSLIRVPLRLPQSAQASVRPGDAVELRSETIGWCWTGLVESLAPEADASTRTLTAFVEVSQDPQGESLLLPGRFLRAVVSASPVERLVVPRSAMIDDRVMVEEEGIVAPRFVVAEYHIRRLWPEMHPTEQEWIVLGEASNLRAGDRVILSNPEELRAGEHVVSAVNEGGSIPGRAAGGRVGGP